MQPTMPGEGLDAVGRVPRNAPCPCGSGKKYKHCCLQKEARRDLKSIEHDLHTLTLTLPF